MKKIMLLVMIILLVLLSACTEKNVKGHSSIPDAKEILTLNPKADIFMWDERVYTYGVDWVEKLELTKDKELGEITSRSPDSKNVDYKNGMANKLPIGAKIYSLKEQTDVLLIEYDGKQKKYLGVSEG